MAEAVQAEKKAFRAAKERLTLIRRDIVKMIDAAIAEKVPGPWGRMAAHYEGIMAKVPRSAPRQLVEAICVELHELWTEVREVLEPFTKTQNKDANESHSGRHIQNSNPDSKFESEDGFRDEVEASREGSANDKLTSLPKRDLPLGLVLDACSDLRDLSRDGDIRHWRDFLATVEFARPMLGISPSAWAEARAVMGDQHAAITLAAMLQRAAEIKNAGGYLRNLTERAKEGKFSTWPMVMALLRAKLEGQKKSVQDDHGVGRDLDTTAAHFVEQSRLDVLRGHGRGLGRDGFGLDWR